MKELSYEVIEHDGGWAYSVNGSISETFATHEQAHQAAGKAAREQMQGGENTEISYEDSSGETHTETSSGSDRPTTTVIDQK